MEAASLTGLARYTVQGAAPFCAAPSDMLRAMHTALRQRDASTFCTACLLVIEFAPDGGAQAQICLGGHPAPLLRRADGEVVPVGEPGSILGWFEPVLRDAALDLAPGDVLVLYTDGLTDAPGEQAVPIEEVVELLAAGGATLPVGRLADDIRGLKRRRRPHGSTDDTALLCLRFTARRG
jgi:serine phosphatase RsbU (regulator of sigma subunit)